MPQPKAETIDKEVREGSLRDRAVALLKTLGPGLITGASDDDPATIGTVAQTGARFGYTQLWTMLFTIPLMIVVQEMCARIGLQTGEGLAGIMRKHYPRPVLYLCVALLIIVNVINLGADLGAMAAAAALVVPLPFILLLLAVTLVSAGLEIFLSYDKYARILRYFTLSLFAYIVVALIIPQDWGQVLRSTIIPTLQFSPDWLLNIVAILGTSVSPYLFFWQTNQEVEEKVSEGEVEEHSEDGKVVEQGKRGVSRVELRWMRADVASGMILSNLVTWFIIITSASTLGAHGQTTIDSAAKAAEALKPVAGPLASLLFAVGIVGIGLLAVPVLAGSIAYAVSGTMRLQQGLTRRFWEAPTFYAIIGVSTLVGAGINLLGINPMQALYYTSVLSGVIASPLLIMLMLIANNRQIMADKVNSRFSNVVGWLTTLVTIIAAVALIANLILGGGGS